MPLKMLTGSHWRKMNAQAPKQFFGYAACLAIALGCFLPFKHVLFRDMSAMLGGPGIIFLALAGVAAALISVRRYTGAAFCAVAVLVLLVLQYLMMLRINALSSVFWSPVAGGNSPVSPVGLNVHPDVGFYVIGLGAIAVVLVALYRRGNAPTQYVGGSAYAVAERNGNTAINEGEFNRADRAE